MIKERTVYTYSWTKKIPRGARPATDHTYVKSFMNSQEGLPNEVTYKVTSDSSRGAMREARAMRRAELGIANTVKMTNFTMASAQKLLEKGSVE